jgi:hypothetical protein
MTNQAVLPGGRDRPTTRPATPPPLPSITASALMESRLLVTFVRRVVAARLSRG